MKTLYRKYRPLRLEDVVGQEQVTVPLENALKNGKVGHAYLFTGPRGCGKTSVARILAHQVNGFEYTLEDEYVDIIEIDGASNRGIDNIRELREKAAIAPTEGKYKIYIIDEVHMLTKEAFNALLKTLEEPPEHVIFIMATTDAYKVPVTITSRSQIYNFKLASPETMREHIKKVVENEGIKIDDDALTLVARRGGGSFRDTLSLLDQISTLADGEITAELIEHAMGLPENAKIEELIDAYTRGDVVKITTVIKELFASGTKPEVIAEEAIRLIIENPRLELMPLLEKLPEVAAPFAEAKLLVATMPTPTEKTAAPTTRPQPKMTPQVVAQNTSTPVDKSISATSSRTNASETISQTDFDWNGFLERVYALNDAIHMQLKGARYDFNGSNLTIYPAKSIARTILSRDNNKQILTQASGGVKITIAEQGASPASAKNDGLISKISDIMGGEVKNDGGDNPF